MSYCGGQGGFGIFRASEAGDHTDSPLRKLWVAKIEKVRAREAGRHNFCDFEIKLCNIYQLRHPDASPQKWRGGGILRLCLIETIKYLLETSSLRGSG
jgi:hypothetical protein